jgi:hypothetical protein
MYSHVCTVVITTCKVLLTNITPVRFVRRVTSHVHLHITLHCKRSRAHGTLEGFLPGVYTDVSTQCSTLCELLGTMWTVVRTDSRVLTEMYTEVLFCAELFETNSAEVPFVFNDWFAREDVLRDLSSSLGLACLVHGCRTTAHLFVVFVARRQRRECFVAHGARVWFRAGVCSFVCAKVRTHRERFPTCVAHVRSRRSHGSALNVCGWDYGIVSINETGRGRLSRDVCRVFICTAVFVVVVVVSCIIIVYVFLR